MADFLQFMRGRFKNAFKAIAGDPVPWELDDKFTAYSFVASKGWRTPKHQRFATLREALASAVGRRFVLKRPGLHSTRGVFLLERTTREGRFLNLLTLREESEQSLLSGKDATGAEYWMVEECVESTVCGRPVPFDYKFYCFGGQVGLILQMDRNFSPPRACYFDGSFIPLQHGKDYTLDPQRWLPSGHVIPLHASQMVTMARELSHATGSRYVSVDCYDSPTGPVFGEFTFASGAPDVGMVVFSQPILEALGVALDGAAIERISGIDIDYEGYWSEAAATNASISVIGPDAFSRVAAAASFGDKRYRQALGSMGEGSIGQHYQFSASLITAYAGAAEEFFALQDSIFRRRGFINGSGREDEFIAKAKEHHLAKKNLGHWHECRLAEIDAARGDPDALAEISRLSRAGYPHAQRVEARLVQDR